MSITVVIPVGPDPIYRKYLPEAIESVQQQTLPPAEILFIDDQAHLPTEWHDRTWDHHHSDFDIDSRVWRTPWLSGVAHSFNFGVALANHDLVFMMGSDDRLLPDCLSDCWRAFQDTGGKPGYYWVDVVYSDDGEEQALPCNAAMVHKDTWRTSGGFPVESAVGPCDTMLVSILTVHGGAGALYHVESAAPPYWYRRHDQTYSRTRGSRFFPVWSAVRNTVTELWTPPAWAAKAGTGLDEWRET